MTSSEIYPYGPIHPGEILRDETMPGHNWTVASLAEKLRIGEAKVIDFINERIPVDRDLSAGLGKLMGIDKNFWLRLQQGYELEIIENDLKTKMDAAGIPANFDEVNKQKTVLAALSVTKPNSKIGSDHIQTIIFKMDREIDKSDIWIPEFSFVPHDHGPFDYELNSTLIKLVDEGLGDIKFPSSNQKWKKRKFILNQKGRDIGAKFLEKLPKDVKSWI